MDTNPKTPQPVDEREGMTSASSFERKVQCAGSEQAERNAVASGAYKEVIAEVAEAGTRIHEALLTGELSDLVNNEEQIATKIKAMETQAKEQWLADLGLPTDRVMREFREFRFWVKSPTESKITSAKVDVAYVVETVEGAHCLLLDAKTGFLEVTHARSNWQLRVGIVALDREFGPFLSARVAIAQYRTKEAFSRCDYARADLDHSYTEIVFYDSRAKQPEAPFAAGKWCRYCKAAGNCPTYAAYGLLPSVQSQTLGLKKKDIEARVAELAPADLAFIHSRETAANSLFDAVKARLKAMSDENLKLIGLEKVSTGSNPSEFDVAGIWKALAGQKLVSEEEFKKVCKVGLGALSEIVVPKLALRNECSQKDAAGMMSELVSPFIIYTPKEKSIKPIKTS